MTLQYMPTPSNAPADRVSSEMGRWRTARRLLQVLAATATFIAVFYTVENWRGQRAWENRRRELEAKGEVLDWAAYIPPPVPDEQNFFKAQKMREWFVRPSTVVHQQPADATSRSLSPGFANGGKAVYLVLADVKVVSGTNALNSTGSELVMRLDDPVSGERAARLLEEAVEPYLIGANGSLILFARALDAYRPPHWVVQSDTAASLKDLVAFFPRKLPGKSLGGSDEGPDLDIEQVGRDLFRVVLKKPAYWAADYLAWTDQLKPNFDLVRQALKRPYAQIDCDNGFPFVDIPNFINQRLTCQTLAMRAQSYLLMGEPEEALHELTLVHDLSRVSLAKPFNLVGAMIHVAIQGLYAGIIRYGLELHAWREPQLLALEQQLKGSNLLQPVAQAFRDERASTSRIFEVTKPNELIKLLGSEGLPKVTLRWMPRGWYYQNMAAGAAMEQQALDTLDPANQLVQPRPVTELIHELASEYVWHSPYRFLAWAGLPNLGKALQTTAANQTLINQARIACALERVRLAQGRYPESLDALTPEFIEKLPHDVIGGQSLKYRLNQDGGYLLYSIGWDEKDSGGVPGNTREEGDWVWAIH